MYLPENQMILENMQRIASHCRVTKIARIKLSNFFSVEANLVFSIPNAGELYVNISFLRNEDFMWVIDRINDD